MNSYIDGFVFPIARKHLSDYRRLADAVAKIWIEHGALDYREYVGDDMMLEGTRSFIPLAEASEDDVVVFGWVEFESRASRDLVNEKVAQDARIPELVAATDSGFDAARMAYGGFEQMVASRDQNQPSSP